MEGCALHYGIQRWQCTCGVIKFEITVMIYIEREQLHFGLTQNLD